MEGPERAEALGGGGCGAEHALEFGSREIAVEFAGSGAHLEMEPRLADVPVVGVILHGDEFGIGVSA